MEPPILRRIVALVDFDKSLTNAIRTSFDLLQDKPKVFKNRYKGVILFFPFKADIHRFSEKITEYADIAINELIVLYPLLMPKASRDRIYECLGFWYKKSRLRPRFVLLDWRKQSTITEEDVCGFIRRVVTPFDVSECLRTDYLSTGDLAKRLVKNHTQQKAVMDRIRKLIDEGYIKAGGSPTPSAAGIRRPNFTIREPHADRIVSRWTDTLPDPSSIEQITISTNQQLTRYLSELSGL